MVDKQLFRAVFNFYWIFLDYLPIGSIANGGKTSPTFQHTQQSKQRYEIMPHFLKAILRVLRLGLMLIWIGLVELFLFFLTISNLGMAKVVLEVGGVRSECVHLIHLFNSLGRVYLSNFSHHFSFYLAALSDCTAFTFSYRG